MRLSKKCTGRGGGSMGRKVFGKSLERAMDEDLDDLDGEEAPSPSQQGPTVSRAIEALRDEDRHSTRMISPSLIHMSQIMDRLDPSEDLDGLIASIQEEGQKVPILVRRLPDGDLEVVYGRRRLLACRALGRDVRATVMEMTDEESVIAQGVENNERLDTSFIERALFVSRILDAGFKAVVVTRATGIDKTSISLMKGIVEGIPEELIQHIGPAHGAGRRQWDQLRSNLKDQREADISGVIAEIPRDRPSPERLAEAIRLTRAEPRPQVEPPSPPGITTKVTGSRLTISAGSKKDRAFLKHLETRLPELLEEWRKS